VADIEAMKPPYVQTLAGLLVINTVTLAAVYALISNNNGIRNLVAATLLAAVVVAQTILCRPFVPILSWVSTIPVAIAMAYLIGANPDLDWSGPCEADQVCFAPILPIVVVVYAIGFALIAGAIRWASSTLRNRYLTGKR
jgi:hypothetical protein